MLDQEPKSSHGQKHILLTEGDEDSDFDHGDEYEESIGDSAEHKGRQSIAEMVTLHKLHTATPISSKMRSHFMQPLEADPSESSIEPSSDSENNPVKRTKTIPIQDCDAFDW